MKRIPFIAGNWKMNCTTSEAVSLVEGIKALISDITPEQVEVAVCPPFTALHRVAQLIEGTYIRLGAQDVFWKDKGAYTGQISPVMLKDVGCTYVIIGHSERRGRFGVPDPDMSDELLKLFGDNDATVNRKITAALSHGLKPIVCVGETLSERERGLTDEIVRRQVIGALNSIPTESVENITFAYEPVWAIGTGNVCDAYEANRVIGMIRGIISELYSSELAERVRIQYGGSVTPENIEELALQPEIDGALVGGASLRPDSFSAIVRTTMSAKQRIGQK
ncbi:MAG: triose-phosphate isomerase [Armatimonadota bacterium]|nr:triose-phosphate isomerase [Armatimonadota bacterium]MCX7777811.1 triose-phosphate isomerase [Armatimonadota bacterium]MDW8025925.1 triose-phosphate isomerase [Armatimonadota bacterium]